MSKYTRITRWKNNEIYQSVERVDKGVATKPPKYHCSKCGLDYYHCPPFCRKCGGKVVEKGKQ